MMTLSKQRKFTFNSLLEDIRGSLCCVNKVRQYIYILYISCNNRVTVSTQSRANVGPPTNRHLNGVSLPGQ